MPKARERTYAVTVLGRVPDRVVDRVAELHADAVEPTTKKRPVSSKPTGRRRRAARQS